MKTTVLYTAIALAGMTAMPAWAQAPETLRIGSEVRGEITSSDPINRSDGSRSRTYEVTLSEGQLVSFSATGSLRARLALFDDSTILADSASNYRYNSAASISYKAREAGTYVLAVSGADADAFGPYRVNSVELQTYDGSVLRGEASISDWIDQARPIPLQVDRRGLYTIDMMSDDFDTYLTLEGNGVSVTNDDGGDGTNARLSTLLEPGRYTLTTDGYSGNSNGAYTLTVARQSVPANLNQGGRLTANRGEIQGLYGGTPLQYQFRLDARQLVTIDMRSDQFDSYLRLSGNGVDATDDDGGDGLNARLSRVLTPGEYTISAEGLSGSGMFQLGLVTANVPEGTGGGPIAVGEEKQANLLGGATDSFTFSIATAGHYVIDMRSDDFDSYLTLYHASGAQITSDDDSGGSLNARIEIELEPGDYRVEASSFGGSSQGNYSVSLRAQ